MPPNGRGLFIQGDNLVWNPLANFYSDRVNFQISHIGTSIKRSSLTQSNAANPASIGESSQNSLLFKVLKICKTYYEYVQMKLQTRATRT